MHLYILLRHHPALLTLISMICLTDDFVIGMFIFHISHCRGAWGVAPAGHVVVYSVLKILPPKTVVINFLISPTEPQLHPLPSPRPSLYIQYKIKLN